MALVPHVCSRASHMCHRSAHGLVTCVTCVSMVFSHVWHVCTWSFDMCHKCVHGLSTCATCVVSSGAVVSEIELGPVRQWRQETKRHLPKSAHHPLMRPHTRLITALVCSSLHLLVCRSSHLLVCISLHLLVMVCMTLYLLVCFSLHLLVCWSLCLLVCRSCMQDYASPSIKKHEPPGM